MDTLIDAVKKGDATKLKQLLDGGANPNGPAGRDGLLALHVAAAAGQTACLEILLKNVTPIAFHYFNRLILVVSNPNGCS